MDLYQSYIHMSRYSRWQGTLNRRETWEETVQRYIDFFDEHTKYQFTDWLNVTARPAIIGLEVMPSMRALMSAGEALKKENLAGFNCSYLAINTVKSFAEILYILMCGTGVGFSCERQEIVKLPVIPDDIREVPDVVIVADSRLGWVEAFQEVLQNLYYGRAIQVDYSQIRPAGAPLKTFGGRASGPAPLKRLLEFFKTMFRNARGRRLTSIEIHDLICVIGEVVVVGGVRRSALISLSNLSDQRMRDAKTGQWWRDDPQRALANNSVAYTEKPEMSIFLDEWLSLIKSKSGERGIFNRVAATRQATKWGRRPKDGSYGCNPCSEIILQDKQLCNLTEVIVRRDDLLGDLLRKVKIATILGTFQATLTDFNFLDREWSHNTSEESLLGVSLTGIMDNPLMNGNHGDEALRDSLNMLRDHARCTNEKWAPKLNIKVSAAITCVKPSGTVSQLCNTASGIHPRHSQYYIRTVRIDKKDPLYHFVVEKGFLVEDDVMKPDSTGVLSFAIHAPEGCMTRRDMTAMQTLKMWLTYQRDWCEHKPSITVNVKDHEWLEVGAWVYKHFNEMSGIAFLPFEDHNYQQAPYQEITEKEYNQWLIDNPVPEINWRELAAYENDDNTNGSQTLACSAGGCEA